MASICSNRSVDGSDRGAKHVREADEAIYIGNITNTPHPHQNIELLTSSAKSVHADAVHPGIPSTKTERVGIDNRIWIFI